MTDLAERARGRRLILPGHFAGPVMVEGVEPIGDGWLQLRVGTSAGTPSDDLLTESELEEALADAFHAPTSVYPGSN